MESKTETECDVWVIYRIIFVYNDILYVIIVLYFTILLCFIYRDKCV